MININEYINRCKSIYGDNYLYDNINYTGMLKPVTILCKEHGTFEVIARNFLRGTECQFCKNKFNRSIFNKNEFFIYKALLIHGDKYNYKNVNYIDYNTKVDIICEKHGLFKQRPSQHLKGNSCPKCAKEKWNIEYNIPNNSNSIKNNWLKRCNFQAYLYIIQCYNDTEKFIKIGITKHKNLRKRFTCVNTLPYDYNIIYLKEDTPENIWNLEKEILKKFRDKKYKPLINFKGKFECFDISINNNLNFYINEALRK